MAGAIFRSQLRGLLPSRSLGRPVPMSFSQPAPAVQSSSKPLGHPWRVVVAVCVQRLPSLTRETTDVERRYQLLKEQLRVERSVLSDYELEEKEYVRLKSERERRALEEDALAESSNQNEVEEFEELLESREQEQSSFQTAPCTTEADQSGDLRSHRRLLDKMLYLLVRKDRASHCWQIPQSSLEEGESLLQGARRGLTEGCGGELRVDFLSGTPSTYHCYHHSHLTDPGIIGSKVFFLKAQYRGGEIQLVQQGRLIDYVWLTKNEMKDYVSVDYFNAVASTLID